MNNFESVSFEPVEAVAEQPFIMKGGLVREFKGIIINNEKYAVHLVYCNREDNGCIFRINGVMTENIKPQEDFPISSEYSIKINSIDFYYCNEQRFCDYYFEAYHKVELLLEREEL